MPGRKKRIPRAAADLSVTRGEIKTGLIGRHFRAPVRRR
jgi:hypothetical protein